MPPEPGACLSLWPTEECEWSTWDIWRSSDVIEHAIYLILALMLGYTLFALSRFLFHYFLYRREWCDSSATFGANDFQNRRNPIPEIIRELGMLKGISSAAPFLGLAGTSYGILCALWFSYSGSPQRYVALLFTRIAFAFTTTLAGTLVALPATIVHSLVRTRIEKFFSTSFSTNSSIAGVHSFRFAETLPLRRKFSGLPPFALLAAPALASVIALFTPFHPYRVPVGLRVLLPSFSCHADVADRIIVLQVTSADALMINFEPVSRADLPRRLSDIYRTRASRELYLLPNQGVPFQTVADVIDTVRSINDPEFDSSLDIKIVLITPRYEAEIQKCLDPLWERSVRRRR